MSDEVTPIRPDALGLLLLVALGGWILVAGRDADISSRQMLGSIGVLAGSYVVGRLTRRFAVVVACLAALGVAVFLTQTGDPRHAGALAPPLDYANADAALAVQAAALVGLAAALVRNRAAALILTMLATGFVAYAVLIHSAAGAATGLLVLAVLLVVGGRRPRGTRAMRAVAAGAALGAVAVTIALGVAQGGSGTDALTERRVHLWHDAVVITQDHPVTGVGPGEFDQASPTAAADADTRAAHSAVLEQAAETGVPGALLLVALMLWVLWRAGAANGGPVAQTAAVAVVVAAWTAFALHSAVDYVADFPAVLGLLGLVTGLGTAQRVRAPAQAPEPAAGTRG